MSYKVTISNLILCMHKAAGRNTHTLIGNLSRMYQRHTCRSLTIHSEILWSIQSVADFSGWSRLESVAVLVDWSHMTGFIRGDGAL